MRNPRPLGVDSLLLSAYFIFKSVYFGSLYPNTYFAKMIYPFQNAGLTFSYLREFYFREGFALPVMLLVSLAAVFVFLNPGYPFFKRRLKRLYQRKGSDE